ncbi:unnamed protein product [Rotaria socialis]
MKQNLKRAHFHSFTNTFYLRIMFPPQIHWSCSQCRSATTDRRKYCTTCHSLLTCTFIGSQRSGLYTNYYRHRDNCSYCTPEFEQEKQQEIEEMQ